MKTLDLDAVHRRYLFRKLALIVDCDGSESLAGLSHAESAEYLTLTSGPSIAANLRKLIDPMRFLDLYDRHMTALTSSPSLFEGGIDWT